MKRRYFIRLSTFTAGVWLLTDLVPVSLSASGKPVSPEFSPDPLLKISETGKVTIFMVKQEMGQNVITSLPLLIAEELEVDLKEINIEALPYEVARSGNYTTWASGSITGNWLHLLKVGATAKAMLMTAAATKWKVPIDLCKAQNSRVINTATKEILFYKDLVKEASALIPPNNITLKEVKDFKLIGQKTPKTNSHAILTGKYAYTMDVKLPGMLYAALVRCPVYSGKIVSWDTNALNGLSGFVKVVQVTQMNDALNRNAVAVIATNTWAALQGQRLLKVNWDYALNEVKDTPSLNDRFKKELSNGMPAQVYGREKNAPFEPLQHPQVYEATYEIPYMAHAAMEPMNCTAWFKDEKFEVWGGFQAPMFINSVLPQLFNIDRSDIAVNLMPIGGSFGRKEKIDGVADAMQLAKALRVPVQVIYSRIDDLQNDFYRHASYHHLSAVAEPVRINQWRHQLGIATFPGKEISGPWHTFGGVMNDLCYTTGDYQSAFYPVESPVPLGSWRSISFSPNVFAIESFIDELAVHNHIDPITFRFNILDTTVSKDNLRLKNVLSKCADQIGWWQKPAKGRFRGVACCIYGHSSSMVAHAMEISVDKDKLVTIHRCVAAVDCGLVIDPDGLMAQVEGSLVWALSGIFKNEITISNGIVDQQSFADYQVLRMNEMPSLEIVLVPGAEKPGGGGEPAVPSVGPALCNAIFAATGFRIRELPVKKHGFRLA
jgi:isoquinoline 1-oxidoreductase beta subunit